MFSGLEHIVVSRGVWVYQDVHLFILSKVIVVLLFQSC